MPVCRLKPGGSARTGDDHRRHGCPHRLPGGESEADAVEQLLRRGAIRTTVISRFELLSGAKNPKQLARLVQLLGAVPSLGLDDAAADAASEIRRSLE
ncbi:MAG: PIN domain-containing protein [Bryobacteraceae bacterium]